MAKESKFEPPFAPNFDTLFLKANESNPKQPFLRPQIAQLVEDVHRLQASLSALQEAHAQQLQRLEERLDEKKQHIARLEARLDTQRDYDDIKREIR